MKKFKTMDGNEAVARVAYNFSEICGIYPITPASPMAEKVDQMSSTQINYFGNKVRVVEMQSEAGAVAMSHGALQSGALATTFTASQGLLLMIPTLYKLAGEMQPGVIHVAARALASHALSIFGDHQDVYSTRASGCCMLASSSVEQAYHLANIAHLSAIKGSLPFIHFFDGFRTSHELDKIELIDEDKIKTLIDQKAVKAFRDKAMNPNHPNTRGTAENDDIYFQHAESRNTDYDNMVGIVENYMSEINKIAGTDYKPFNYYGEANAEHVIIAMGSMCEAAKETIDYLNTQGYNVGLVEVHLYRPFSVKHLLAVLPKSVKKIAVMDRTVEHGAIGEPLFLDVSAALEGSNIKVIGGRYGLSSKDVSPSSVKAVFDYVKGDAAKSDFTVGINDDVTHKSIPVDYKFTIPTKNHEFLIYGYGSDGMVSTAKDIMKVLGDNTDLYVQGYFQYDSKKAGGVTRSHLRVADEKIRSTYYATNPRLVVVSKESYIFKYNVLDNIKDKGVLLLNTSLDEKELLEQLPNKIKHHLAAKGLECYYIDAYKLVTELGLANKINTCMETCMFKILDIIDINKVINILKEQNEKRFAKKGEAVVNVNNAVVDNSLAHLKKLPIDKAWADLKFQEYKPDNFNDYVNDLEGNTLPVSAFLDKKGGAFPPATTQYEKRGIATSVPKWHKDNCIQCNQCSFVCPHSVIRPFISEEDHDSLPAILPERKDLFYNIAVSYEDCTGCGVCAHTCPGRQGNTALTMEQYDKEEFKEDNYIELLKTNINKSLNLGTANVKNSQFTMPKFEFHGACAGCGETAYLRVLSQVLGDNLMIANATGCSSIYGGSAPSQPWNVPWANSLFEDNAEFGLGIALGSENNRLRVKNVWDEHSSEFDKETNDLFDEWLKGMDDYASCKAIYDKLEAKKFPYFEDVKDYLLPKSVWVVGGDGFAYDIGYGGLDHVLSTNANVNVLILDTEVYSNTGGQSSKSSNLGSIAAFTATGKETYKKDLARMALSYPHVYVASVNIGHNKQQYLQALKEASEHKGPSIIIAYAPCIEHGIIKGMNCNIENSALATKSGYYLTFRYNPDTKEFKLDSKDVNFELYDEFLSGENRYARLKNVNSAEAKELLARNKQWAENRFEFYSKLSS